MQLTQRPCSNGWTQRQSQRLSASPRSHTLPRRCSVPASCTRRDQPSPSHQDGASANHPAQLPAALAATAAGLTTLCAAHPASATVLDAPTVHLLADILRPTFTLFTFLYIVRIPMTWYPDINPKSFPWTVAYTPTEPILSVTRKIVPLVGGVDVTPIVWVGLLSFFSEILLGPQGLLVLIERQGGL